MSGVRMLEELAVNWKLPEDFWIDVLETRFVKYFSERPGELLVRCEQGGVLVWDEHALLLLERDLLEVYAARYKKKTGRNLARILGSIDDGFQVRRYCAGHELPICTLEHEANSVGSPITHVGIFEALKFDLRLAAKYADDDARVFSEKRPRESGFMRELVLGGAFIAGVFFASYFGVSLAVSRGIENAKAEIDSYVVPKFREELREGIDDNVERYAGSFLTRNSDGRSDSEENAVRQD